MKGKGSDVKQLRNGMVSKELQKVYLRQDTLSFINKEILRPAEGGEGGGGRVKEACNTLHAMLTETKTHCSQQTSI